MTDTLLPPVDSKQAQKDNDNATRGIAYAIVAFFFFAVMNVFAKLLFNNGYHVIEIAFYRNLVAIVPFLALVYLRGGFKTIIPVNTRGIIARSIIGSVSLIATFGAFAHLPMADATALIFASSLILPVLAYFILKEQVGIYRWSAVLIGFFGVLIMAQPSGAINITGIIFALSAASMHAVIQTMVRWLGRTDHPFVITFYFIAIGTLFCGALMPFVAHMPDINDIWMFISIGVTGALGQFCITSAYKNAQASIVTIFNYSGIIWATIFGWFIWSDWPSAAIWAGGTIVIASNIFIIYRENRLKKQMNIL